MRSLKFRAWDNDNNKWLNKEDADCLTMYLDGRYEINRGWSKVFPDLIIEQYTGLKDKNGDKEIYEYDIIDGEGNIIGNYHETPELLKDKTNLLIQGFGTKAWLTTYQEAVERGCHDAQ